MADLREESAKDEGDLRERIWRVIFLSDTRAGQVFDVMLLLLILASVLVVMLESVGSLRVGHVSLFWKLEWFFTLIFTAEYIVRMAVVRRKRKYALSFFGIVDLLSILPTYVALLLTGTQYLMVIRILRLLRMFRVLKMAHHFGQANVLMNALRSSGPKIAVFLFFMLSGFSIIAVPTGIVTAEIGKEMTRVKMDGRECSQCGWKGHDPAANHCKHCGNMLHV